MEQQSIIGIDVGATNTKVVVVASDGMIVERAQRSTHIASADTLFAGVFELISALRPSTPAIQQGITAIGLVSGGRYEQATGTPIFGTAALPGWVGTPVRSVLEERYGVPVWVDNDGNGAALAEWTYGVGRGSASFVCLTLGTGLGGGTVIRGHLLQGVRGNAGELGTLRSMSMGARVAAEAAAAGSAMSRRPPSLRRHGTSCTGVVKGGGCRCWSARPA